MALPLLPQRGSRMYVEGLPPSVDDEILSMYFSQFGALEECRVIKENGESKRFGFVSFCTPAVCQRVASIVHTLNGGRIHVERMNQDHTDNFEFSLPSKRLFVSLTGFDDIDETLLRPHFSNSGQIKSIHIEKAVRSGPCLYAIVTFESEKSVDDAVDSVHILGGKTLIVKKMLSSEEVKKGRQTERERAARESRMGRMEQFFTGPVQSIY
ncbi:hypothetical protein PMAYCL1PPCAC_12363 [Pristionchus mayeri]|uniref:RRM domain-containing protein n=1 Tax=Pristionchus mayeri TaxID=1317129 RepID=A0AAN5C8Z0_9BILA|nr:hypothetical protein PMAYCL1PPCAC_12363 [Pristionchus mayeri]